MFEDMIRDWFSEDSTPYNDFLKAFLCQDVDYMNDYMNQVAASTFSSFDTGKQLLILLIQNDLSWICSLD